MRLLVTNDDGIESIFLHKLIQALLAAGHKLTIAAPRTEQSWVGAAKSRNRAVESRLVDHGFGCPTWVIDGTPSDCVNIALDHLVDKNNPPEGVVSGINMGLNASLGFIIASGTIAGAFEGALHGLPAAALSQDLTIEIYDQLKYNGGIPDAPLDESLTHSAAHAARIVPQLLASTGPRKFVVHNLNFPCPCTPDSKVLGTVPAQVVVPRLFSPASDDGTHRMIFRYGEDHSPEGATTDRTALANGFISHSVLDYTQLGRCP